jgi:gas vesicle protein
MMDERTIIIKKGSVSSLLTGMMIGAGLALLFAPQTGNDTRGMLTEKGMEIRDKAVEIARDTRERAQHSLEDARNKMQDKMRSMKEGASMTAEGEAKQLKRELEIMEDVNNPSFPL